MNQPIYGTPLIPWALTYAPTNELGVVYLFGTVARELGYAVTRMLQTGGENMQDTTSFWSFSLKFYSQPEVGSICLDLQDRFGADVLMMP